MKFNGTFIVESLPVKHIFKYKVISHICDFSSCDCIIIKYLNPDFSFLLDNINLIITEMGSGLSHLAIIAREYGKNVILVEDIINKIHKIGKLTLIKKNGDVKIEIK